MNVLARFATGLLFALSLTQCATQREVDLGREFTRDSRKGRSVIDSANQSFDLVLSLAYPQQDPCVEMVRNIMNQNAAANHRYFDARIAKAARIPQGKPLSTDFINRDPTLALHKQWCDAVTDVLTTDVAGVREIGDLARRNAERLDIAFRREPATSYALGLRLGASKVQAAVLAANAAMATVKSVRKGVAYLEKTRGRWSVMNGKLIFLRTEEMEEFKKLQAQTNEFASRAIAGGNLVLQRP